MAAAGGILARLAPVIARVGGSVVGQAAKRGAIAGVEGRVANMVQGRKDGTGSGNGGSSLDNWESSYKG